ncbi:hypothetical protein PENSOL_c007G06446 [Penicillium solitum]|uniref:F-box domain-containing protein n=1 Tax=Penicillium solitum TaxID=60172 RepID=A0A1V6RC65_9EURO|nr:uncharacterized protein PENSOL_c007G06446 [Penicillium solitum]OQD99135.1 hypothetical protein PENSOL_c007G06446 [Penicillium solitum]
MFSSIYNAKQHDEYFPKCLAQPTAGHIHQARTVPQNGKAKLPQVAETELGSKAPPVPSPLESLPSEIRRQILSILEIDNLRSLVQASPIYYHQYQLDRRLLLCQSLEVTLGSVTVEAYAGHKSNSMEVSNQRTAQGIDNFLTFYHPIRSEAWSSPLHKVLSIEEVTSMARFYCSIVQPLVGWWISISDSIMNDFLYIFNPWETEEISCVSYLTEEKFKQIFNELKWDLDEEKPKFDRRRGEFDLNNHNNKDGSLKTPVSRGLELLYLVYFKVKNHDQLVTAMRNSMSWVLRGFLEDTHSVFDERLQWNRHCVQPGDKQPNGDCTLPPLACTMIWGGTYSNLFGDYIPDALCQWGWVMWDAARLERMGAKEVMIQKLEEDHCTDLRKDYWYADADK